MKKSFLVAFILTSLLFNLKSTNISDSLEVSLVTVSPGNELYSTFGHSAIRIKDLIYGHDLIFNYGTFNPSIPFFYFKFALGKLDYMLSVENYDDFIQSVKYENRCAYEQILNFNKTEKIALIMGLLNNYKPENRYYRYKFFTDNCATRIRDILNKSASDPTFLITTNVDSGKTFRQLFLPYLKYNPWSRFGINILLGAMADRPAKIDALFLPDKLKQAIDNSFIFNKKSVYSEKTLYTTNLNQKTSSFTPIIASIILFLFSIIAIRWKRFASTFDPILFIIIGFTGVFITTLSFFSAHAELHANYNILLFFPGLLLVPFLKKGKFKNIFCWTTLGIILLTLILFVLKIIPQHIDNEIIILILAILIRIFFNTKN